MQFYGLLCLLVTFIVGYYGQDPTSTPAAEWNGDPRVCVINPSESPDTTPLPRFHTKAEFGLERVEIRHIMNETLPSQLTMYEYLYDYDANKLILVTNTNGFIETEYYYYELLKKSVYRRREFCDVKNIPTNIDMDGLSAIEGYNKTWHIRPMNEFLLFSSNDPRHPTIRPKYVGQDIVRGIPVDQWNTCIVNKTAKTTILRIWYFAQKGVKLPNGVVGEFAVPVQALISASAVGPDGTEVAEFDEVFNVHSYRGGITESSLQLAPPKGVFCNSGPGQKLISLRDADIEWPDRFSVRVEASTSRNAQWQRFHLRYDRGRQRGSRRLRYDYMPVGSEHYESVIHDYGENLTYIIDRQTGSCKINRGVEIADVSPISDPIGFFIKHEDQFIFRSREPIWESNGFRACRGNSATCASVVAEIKNFPVVVEPDTGETNGETWDATNMEYGWSSRAPFAPPPPGERKQFDYPVYLFLRFYRQTDSGGQSLVNVRTEDVEYEFYEMSHELNPNDFDTSTCYRSNNFDYLHLGFTLKVSPQSVIDGNHLNRRALERYIHFILVERMEIQYPRVSDVEVIHESATNEVNVLFTLLGPTPRPESPTGISEGLPSASDLQDKLRKAINDGTFKFNMRLVENDNTSAEAQFQAVSNSLKGSKQFMSSHSTGKQVVTESYTSGSQAGAVIGGIIVGLLLGVLLVAIIRIVRKEPMPALPKMNTVTNPLPNISFYNKKPTTPAETTAPAATSEA